MLVWFVVGSVGAVALVFDSPAMDFRLVALGAVLPVVEGVVGGPWVLHAPITGVALLGGVMAPALGKPMRSTLCTLRMTGGGAPRGGRVTTRGPGAPTILWVG